MSLPALHSVDQATVSAVLLPAKQAAPAPVDRLEARRPRSQDSASSPIDVAMFGVLAVAADMCVRVPGAPLAAIGIPAALAGISYVTARFANASKVTAGCAACLGAVGLYAMGVVLVPLVSWPLVVSVMH